MHASYTRTPLFIALSLVATIGSAARGMLRADGILRVKGADLSTASITVVPEGASSYSLPIGTKDFALYLPLDDVYLVSVAREGCPTKEIYIDTRIPVEMHATNFLFPFMVTLEHLTADRMFAYAGPVGFVRYLHQLKDFGYETVYIAQVEEDLRYRMDAVRGTGVDPKVLLPVFSALVVDRPRGAYSTPSEQPTERSTGTLAPIVSEVPAMVHVVTAVVLVQVVARPDIAAPGSAVIGVIASDPTRVLVAPVATSVDLRRSGDVPPQPVIRDAAPMDGAIARLAGTEAACVPAQATAVGPGRPPMRTEEMILEPRRITRIVRFGTPSGHANEFRKVTHSYGAVYYFHGTDSITERAFEEATAQEVAGGR